ncbi:formyltransferase family protein [Anaerotruncus colihominis]|uniref:formyltransferase family protein n=1 Tax=Anaerotruncus colihominis TaxID=169435 RepID=UPI0018AB4C04|nr:formyltransferase family protein [Anaerotruncus colihominis]
MDDIKVLLFSKKRNVFCDYAESILRSNFKNSEIISIRGNVGDRLDDELHWYKPEYVISFVSPWIIPQSVLNSAKTASINFHPGSPEYPGTGCYNFALYENSEKYGVTVHHMKEKVDTGDIIMTSYFDISPFESVETLKLKSMNHLLYCFEKIISDISSGSPLPTSTETWKCKPFTRKEMYELFEIDPSKHDKVEIGKRIKAAAYPGSTGAFISVAGCKFFYPYEDRKPIVE